MSVDTRPLYLTTPIYYVNDRPHIGHAYSTIVADLLKRYAQLQGRLAFMLTGTDEHGQKIERRATEEQLSPQEFVDRMAPPFRDMCTVLHCQPGHFIRTTDARHIMHAKRLWQRLVERGDIYMGEYEGWYSVSEEMFYTEKELLEGNLSPVTKKPVEKVRESSYFFRLSNYTDTLLAFYEEHPDFVQPQGRFNEVKQFVREGLRDLSISRTTFRWGVPIPENPEHVMYVWLDALANYLSALDAPATSSEAQPAEASARMNCFWPPHAELKHIVGKDILRFHAVYWPAFLMSAAIPLPTQVWAHGWLTVNGEKMSKSSGNFIPPEPICEAVGTDVLRYYLMRDIALGQDGDFSHSALLARYHGDLGNGLGNLLNRIVSSIAMRHCEGKVPAIDLETNAQEDTDLVALAKRVARQSAQHLEDTAPQKALDAIWELVSATNRYVDQTAPWKLAKEGAAARLNQVVYHVLESLRWLSLMLWPFMPQKCDALRQQIGLQPLMPVELLSLWPSVWGGLRAGLPLQPGEALFPRFDETQERALLERFGVHTSPAAAHTSTQPTSKDPSAMTKTQQDAPKDAFIAFDDFCRVDLRLGRIESAEPVPKSDKLLRLMVQLQDDAPRQILAGLGQDYQPEQLVGRVVTVVTNLKPRKMMGLESQGMILAVRDNEGLSVLSPERTMAPGLKVS